MKTIQLHHGKKQLAILWLSFSAAITGILMLQTLNGMYADFVSRAWNWFIQHLSPNLSLMLSIFAVDAMNLSDRSRVVEKFYYRLAYSFSLLYLLAVLFTLMYRPFTNFAPLEILELSNMWLGPFQVLVSASLGIFFFKEPK